MSERKPWSQEQDAVLKFLKEEEKIGKWSHIARKMAQEHKMLGRNGKQCRQRYYNHLDSNIKREEWTTEQEQRLYQLHDLIGNKWALIAQKMNGRTDNCVKNHFYSKLRKALRKLNKIIHQNFKKQFRQIRMTVLYKIIEATDDKFKEKQTISSQLSLHSQQLKNSLLDYSNDQENNFKGDLQKIRFFIADIYKFSSNYKRKPKKSRQNTCQMKKIINLPKIQKFKCSSDIQDQASDDYIDASEQQSFQLGSKQFTQNRGLSQSKVLMPTPIRHSVYMSNAQNQNLYLSNSMNIQFVLNNAGILQDAYMLSMSDFLKRSLSFSLCSEFSQHDNPIKTEFNNQQTQKDSVGEKKQKSSLIRSNQL